MGKVKKCIVYQISYIKPCMSHTDSMWCVRCNWVYTPPGSGRGMLLYWLWCLTHSEVQWCAFPLFTRLKIGCGVLWHAHTGSSQSATTATFFPPKKIYSGTSNFSFFNEGIWDTVFSSIFQCHTETRIQCHINLLLIMFMNYLFIYLYLIRQIS